MSAGHANRAYLGVAFQDVDGPLAQAFGLPASGIVIHTVAPDSPAARAGLRVGDVVLALQGETIVSARQMVAASRAGSSSALACGCTWALRSLPSGWFCRGATRRGALARSHGVLWTRCQGSDSWQSRLQLHCTDPKSEGATASIRECTYAQPGATCNHANRVRDEVRPLHHD